MGFNELRVKPSANRSWDPCDDGNFTFPLWNAFHLRALARLFRKLNGLSASAEKHMLMCQQSTYNVCLRTSLCRVPRVLDNSNERNNKRNGSVRTCCILLYIFAKLHTYTYCIVIYFHE